ncbi:LysR family transcriptional regulator [Mangrovitalea sediminis]|uniref:LysR family transcriptional regulator n=1 Tax=Mangrovitalea sediminis TaxID=1982043 RepID=UPI000BE55CBA|nr:LysR family transcriptional regulator [Mangrovitalea sediminis]
MHPPITIEALRVLDAIERCGSFAAAASELHRVPSAISYTIQRLEEDLCVSLFDRSGHKAILTPAGRYLLDQGRHLLDAADQLAHTTRQVAQGWETRLKIAINTLLPIQCLFPAIQEFQALGVPVEVQLIEEVFVGAWEALMARRADLVVGADPLTRPAGEFATHPLGEITFVYAVAADHPLTRLPTPLNDDHISAYPAVVAADSARRLPPGSAGIFARQQTLTVTNIDQKIQAQVAGLGVGWLPEPRVRQLLERGQLIALKTESRRNPVSLHLARHTDAQGKALDWFWERLSRPTAFHDWTTHG